VMPVREASLTKGELESARRHRDVRLP
jgi:hypothetical protein